MCVSRQKRKTCVNREKKEQVCVSSKKSKIRQLTRENTMKIQRQDKEALKVQLCIYYKQLPEIKTTTCITQRIYHA